MANKTDYPFLTNSSESTLTKQFNDAKFAGTYHIANNKNLYEIQRTNNFEFVVFFNTDELYPARNVGASTTGTAIPDTTAQEVLRLSVTQVKIPHFSQEAIEVKRGNSSLKYAGVPKFTDGSLTVNDYIGAGTKRVLMAWQAKSYDVVTEKVGLASDYKKDCQLIEYSPDLQVVRVWKLYGCWITGIDEPDYNSESNDKHTISVNISYDKAAIEEDNSLTIVGTSK